MSEPFLSEIKMVGFNFAPRGWALCDGQILPINQNQSLFSLLGTNFGGDGRTTFGLPELRGRSPRQGGDSAADRLGDKSGVESVLLTEAELPAHTHSLQVNLDSSDSLTPGGNYLGKGTASPTLFNPEGGSTASLESGIVSPVGGGEAHNNMQPFIVLNFCIALQGLFPSRN